jgi:hypothetical protein
MMYHVVRRAFFALSLLGMLGASSAQGTHRHPSDDPCSPAGTGSFLGGVDGGVPAGTDSAILGGSNNYACGQDSGIGGGENNTIAMGIDPATNSYIGGGVKNSITDEDGFIGGGAYNANGGFEAFVGGGFSNAIGYASNAVIVGGNSNQIVQVENGAQTEPAPYAAIVGGFKNTIAGISTTGAGYSFIGGGDGNTVNGEYGVVSGGYANRASGYLSTIPGGFRNYANGQYSFAAGYGSSAVNNGTFVWSDDSPTAGHLTSTRVNQFLARASGGVTFFSNAAATTGVTLAPGSGTWGSVSDRNLKTGVSEIDQKAILAKVAALPVSEWSYTSERGVRHIGPMAQDFYAAFGVGEDDRHITTIDEDGVTLAAVKAVHAENRRLAADNAALHRDVARMERELRALSSEKQPIRNR